ncbi:MAG: acyloxyacyl hydrolase [Candidatus Binataceae bacterium]
MAWLPFNMPLLFDPLEGQNWRFQAGTVPYTLVPLSISLRWQPFGICGSGFWRGTPDFSFGGLYTAITRGPESYYGAAIIGARYNFVQPNWRVVPYFEIRGGAGLTDAKQPEEVAHHQPPVGQGQDFTFTFLMSGGVQYNVSPRYSLSAGLAYMHMSNFYLSEPEYKNLGINVYGPMFGMAVALAPIPSVRRTWHAFIRDLEGPSADAPN